MERLNLEQLARLVDERPTPDERAVLEGDPALRRELKELRSQTEALGKLPAVLPPPGSWHDLEKKLAAEGLIFGGRDTGRPWRKWLQAAAALVIFVGGTAFGWVTGSAPAGIDSAASGSESASFASVEEWSAAVDQAARHYSTVYGEGYRQFVGAQGQLRRTRDPTVYLAGIETIMAASRAAVEEAPDDRFLNEMYVRVVAEREQIIRQASSDWR